MSSLTKRRLHWRVILLISFSTPPLTSAAIRLVGGISSVNHLPSSRHLQLYTMAVAGMVVKMGMLNLILEAFLKASIKCLERLWLQITCRRIAG